MSSRAESCLELTKNEVEDSLSRPTTWILIEIDSFKDVMKNQDSRVRQNSSTAVVNEVQEDKKIALSVS